MEIIKEVRPAKKGQGLSARCVVRTRSYVSTLSYFDRLWESAVADFPSLERDRVEVKHYGGKSIRGTFGIEFEPPDKVPNSYREISEVEFVL